MKVNLWLPGFATFLLMAVFGGYRAISDDGVPVSVPALEKVVEDFSRENPKWRFLEGTWIRRESAGNQVLAQTATVDPWAVALLEDMKFSDVDVTVRFRPISGTEDASGGLIFRARDDRNCFLVRANAIEDNFRLYSLVEGKRKTLASASIDAPKLGEWHTMRVVAKGARIQAYLDGKRLLDHEDATFAEGYVGLWTKADSVTEFDDLEMGGTPSK